MSERAHNEDMSKQKKKPADSRSEDRHKGGRMIRQADDVMDLMQAEADAGNRALTREVRQALIEYLTRKGKWPPPGSST